MAITYYGYTYYGYTYYGSYQAYSQHIPEAERGSLIQAYYRRLTSEDRPTREAAAARLDVAG